MAWDAYLHLEGIEGESVRTGHEGDIPIRSFHVGGRLPIRAEPGTPLQVTGRAAISGFQISKNTDKASPQLFQAMCHNMKFETATISFYRGGQQGPTLFCEYELSDVVLSSMNWSGEAEGQDVPMETLELNFERIRVSYTVVASDGSPSGTVEAEYDISTVSS